MGSPDNRDATIADLDAQLARLPDGPMKEALRTQGVEFASSLLRDYLAADSITQADMRAFFESDGPRLAHEVELKIDEGIPTSADLGRWARNADGRVEETTRPST